MVLLFFVYSSFKNSALSLQTLFPWMKFPREFQTAQSQKAALQTRSSALPQTLPPAPPLGTLCRGSPPSLQVWGLVSKATDTNVQVALEEKGQRKFLNFNGISQLLLISQFLFISQFELFLIITRYYPKFLIHY